MTLYVKKKQDPLENVFVLIVLPRVSNVKVKQKLHNFNICRNKLCRQKYT